MNSATSSADGSPGLVRSAATLAYAATCYLLFLFTFLGFIGFVGGMLPAMDHPSMAWWQAALINVALVLSFGLQHSVMARPAFKRMWTRIVPEPAERATYVLAASVTLITLMVFWQPMPGVIWAVHGTAGTAIIWGVFAFGWATVLYTTFLMDHFELFGLRQAWAYATRRTIPDPTFKTPSVYRFARHPMQLGFIIAFWAAPIMTVDRLVVAVLLTGYIIVALRFEERDLVTIFGDEYRRYQERVPRLLPRFRSDL